MASQLYQRACVVTIGSVVHELTDSTGARVQDVNQIRIEGLRCVFKVVKTLKKEPNTLDLKIYNLSAQTRSKIQKKGVQVTLAAGYTNTIATIFSGDARTVDHVREGPDWVTHIQCGDGERAYLYGRVSKTFKPGASVVDVLTSVAQSSGLDTGNLLTQLAAGGYRGGLSQFASSYAAKGPVRDQFDRLLKSIGFDWCVHDGSLTLLRGSTPLAGQVPLLTPDSGLIGSPEHGAPDKKGGPSVLKAKTLLRPEIRCGGQVQIQSQNEKGAWRVEKLEHEGDTSGGNWYTPLHLKPL